MECSHKGVRDLVFDLSFDQKGTVLGNMNRLMGSYLAEGMVGQLLEVTIFENIIEGPDFE